MTVRHKYATQNAWPHTCASGEGCFRCSGKDAGNKGINNIVSDINKRISANKKAGKGSDVLLTLPQRKNVDWKWEVDENGKKTTRW